MRQPKFRGFSLETNSWHYGHGWFEVDYTDEYLKEKGIKQQAMLYTDGYPVECELASMGEFTGLLDSKGTDIYEGDIVKNAFGEEYKIIWDERRCQFIAVTTIEDGSEWYQNVSCSLEVIGNICENSTK
ncbi:hypothetical protein COE14_22760 [Bacillus thuringiensis]|uniref:YopX family protein n=1 Tax=Bacillus thuringiensis TaxID=1428 RepID=UPI000BFC5DF6|nr:YopX family protein [Bacillus thuringiensis]PGW52247.1 hypothetical protein COE14_22760 [Bacillus thuringiensis]